MNCREFRTHLPPYVDGELRVDETAAAGAHIAECPRCRELAERERQFRQLLRRQPQESAPAEVRARILALCRREARRSRVMPWLAAPTLAAAAAAVVLVVVALGQPGFLRSPSLVGELVAQHIAYAQIDHPAEFATTNRLELEEWLRERAGVRATVPDLSSAGIRLVGARIAGIQERKAADVLYEKGHTLLSIFMVPVSARSAQLTGSRVSYRGQEYFTQEWKGYRTVSWTDGQAVFGLVSMLDYDALVECADRLREERASQSRL